MKSIAKIIVLLLVGMGAINGYSQADIQEVPVHFEKGKSSAALKGSIQGDLTVDYTLIAMAGQTMTVHMETDHDVNYFNVLPPNSQTALFVGQINGNDWSGVLPENGKYTIRVYLMRSAARRNEKANYTLEVSITGSASKDVKVAGTEFHAKGRIPCSVGPDPKRSASCDFGVIRSGQGNAEVHTSTPGGEKRVLIFRGDAVSAQNKALNVKAKKQGDEWEVSIDDFEFFNIPEAVINGG